VSPSG